MDSMKSVSLALLASMALGNFSEHRGNGISTQSEDDIIMRKLAVPKGYRNRPKPLSKKQKAKLKINSHEDNT